MPPAARSAGATSGDEPAAMNSSQSATRPKRSRRIGNPRVCVDFAARDATMLLRGSRMTPRITRILAELRERFEALYSHRPVRMVLFGSHARGDAADSNTSVGWGGILACSI